MSKTKEVLFYDPEELSDLQKEINLPKTIEESTKLNEPVDEAVSMFYYEYKKVIWYTIGLVPLNSDGGPEDINYTVDKKYHYLTRSYLMIKLPQLRLTNLAKQKYRIRWPANLAHQIIEKAEFWVDEDAWQTGHTTWYDVNMQWFEKSGHGFRDLRQRDIGNVSYLQEFSDVLPAYNLTPEQPWFYARDSIFAFPIFKCSYMSKVMHKFKFKLDILKLIQIQDIQTEQLLNFSKGAADEITTAIFTDPNVKISKPELWAEYSENHKKEFECQNQSSVQKFYIDDIVHNTSENSSEFGTSVPVKLGRTIYPTKAIFWVAENLNAKEKHIFSNYTTNEDNSMKGWNPISHVSFSAKKGRKFDNLPSEHFDRKSAHHFSSAPFQHGYSAMSLCIDPDSVQIEPGIVLGNNDETMHFKLKDTNPMVSIDKSDTIRNLFTIHVFQLVTKKMILDKELKKIE